MDVPYLHVGAQVNDFNTVGAFAAASTLAVIALVTMVAKYLLERGSEVRP